MGLRIRTPCALIEHQARQLRNYVAELVGAQPDTPLNGPDLLHVIDYLELDHHSTNGYGWD
jgi:hypothetical protein